VTIQPYRKSGLAEPITVKKLATPLSVAGIVPSINEDRRPVDKLAVNTRGMRTDRDIEGGAFSRRLGKLGCDTSWLTGHGKPKIGNRGGGGPSAGGVVLGSGYTVLEIHAKEPRKVITCLGCGIPMYPEVGCKGCKDRRKLAKAIAAPVAVKATKDQPAVRRLRTKEEDELYRLRLAMRVNTEDPDVLAYRNRRLATLSAIVSRQVRATGASPRIAVA